MQDELIEKGTLETGVLHEETWHKDFVLEAKRTIHQVEAMADPLAVKSEYHAGLAILAAQTMKLGEIRRDQINAKLLGQLFDWDLETLQAAQRRLEERLKFFRSQSQGSEDINSPHGKGDRVVRGAPPSDADGETRELPGHSGGDLREE